ncbi:MAG: addiction module protein [Ferruginibacter sp.]
MMNLQYLQDNKGNTTAVVVPIEEWNKFTEKYTDLEELPEWQKKMIDERLESFRQNPNDLVSMEEIDKILDEEEDEEV